MSGLQTRIVWSTDAVTGVLWKNITLVTWSLCSNEKAFFVPRREEWREVRRFQYFA